MTKKKVLYAQRIFINKTKIFKKMKLKLIKKMLKEIKQKEKAGIKITGFDVKFVNPNETITIWDNNYNLAFIIKFKNKGY